jgi:hypothetical protein
MKKLVLTISSFLLSLPTVTWAQEGNTQTANRGISQAFSNVKKAAEKGSFNNNITLNSLVGDIIQLALSLLGALFIVFMIYGGYLWLTAAGAEQKVAKAKKIIFQSIIGLVIIIGAYAISYFIISIFGNQVTLN